MSKFNLIAVVYAGLSVFRQIAFPKDFSPIRVQKARAMQTLAGSLVLIGLAGFLFTGHSWAQSRTISKIDAGRIHYSTLYKPGTVEKIQGEVVSLGKTNSGNGKALCEYLTLKTSQGNIRVILKPESYNPKKILSIILSDQLEIIGSRVMLPGKSALIAAQIRKGSETMVLRDVQTGRPAWAAGDNWHIH